LRLVVTNDRVKGVRREKKGDSRLEKSITATMIMKEAREQARINR